MSLYKSFLKRALDVAVSGLALIVLAVPMAGVALWLYIPILARRHEVRPGITGWAQCHGRNAISWSRKFELDVWYIDHVSFATDCRILLATVAKVLKRGDISLEGETTTTPFNGHN